MRSKKDPRSNERRNRRGRSVFILYPRSLACWVVNPMALPNNDFLTDLRFKGAWRPSPEAERLWKSNVDSFFKPPNGVRLHMKLFKNPKATDAVLIVQGFNETLHKYVEVVHELYSAGFSVALYDHRGQGLSDREVGHVSAAGHVIAFSDFTNDCAAVASHVRDAFQLVKSSTSGRNRGSSGGHLHVVGHSMGGLITAHTVAVHPHLFDGRLVLSAPAFEVVWGAPPGLPRCLAASLGRAGCALGLGHHLAPTPDGQLSWWDPFQAITGVRLTHHQEYLTWYWALRAQNPRVALSGPSMQWIREIAGACAAMPTVAPRVQNATLLLTAEHDDLVAASGHVAFCDLAPCCRRVLVQGAFHEVFFEIPPVSAAARQLMLHWFTSTPATTTTTNDDARSLGSYTDGLVPTIPPTLLAASRATTNHQSSHSSSSASSSSSSSSSSSASSGHDAPHAEAAVTSTLPSTTTTTTTSKMAATASEPICVCVQSSDGSGITPLKKLSPCSRVNSTAATLAAAAKGYATTALQVPALQWGLLTAAGGVLVWVGYCQVVSFRRHRFAKQQPKDTNEVKALVTALASAVFKQLKGKST